MVINEKLLRSIAQTLAKQPSVTSTNIPDLAARVYRALGQPIDPSCAGSNTAHVLPDGTVLLFSRTGDEIKA